MNDDLVAFLRARLDDDGARADGILYIDWTEGQRQLADIEAKRRIIASYEECRDGNSSGEMRDYGHEEGLEEALELLAAVYVGHPDYRDEWKP